MQDWNLDDDEFGQPKKPKARTAYPYEGAGSPILIIVERIPLVARALLLQVQIAVAVPLVLLAGNAMYYSRYLPEILVASCPLGFGFGMWKYFRDLKTHQEQKENPLQKINNRIAREPKPWEIFAWTLGPPVVLFLGSVMALWSHNRFIAATLPALLAGGVFAKWGGEPIKFYEQYLLCQVGVPGEARKKKALPEHRPDLWLFALLLMGIVALPILTSNTVALIVLTVGLAIYCGDKSSGLWRRPERRDAVQYFLFTLVYRICRRFVSYPDQFESAHPSENADKWAPPSTQWHRVFVFFTLLGSLYLVLIVGLSYYCPWEFFAKLTTDLPNETLNSPGTTLQGYVWLFAPFIALPLADPLAVYLLTFVFAVAGFILLPPTILVAIYFPRILELEGLRQDRKPLPA